MDPYPHILNIMLIAHSQKERRIQPPLFKGFFGICLQPQTSLKKIVSIFGGTESETNL